MEIRPKVLVIDDEEGLRDMLFFALEKEGYTVLTAKNGVEGLELISEEDIDIVITDIKMPEMDGITVLEKLKEIKPNLEVVMATGYGTMESAIESLRKGAFDYIHKPFNLDELLPVLVKAIQTSKLKNQLVSMKKLDKMKDEILTLVAHELKTPLTAVGGAVNLLMSNLIIAESKRGELFDIMKRNVQRIRVLIDTILDFSKLEAGLYKLFKTRVSFREILDNCMKQIEPLANIAKIEIRQHKNLAGQQFSSDDISVNCDLEQIERVIINILSNAIKYTSENGKVAVWFDKSDKEVKFVVEDNGKGLAKENLTKVFDKFFRVDNSLTRTEYGLGLGLSICKGIIELHGGKIWVESEGLNQGCKFIFVIPLNKIG